MGHLNPRTNCACPRELHGSSHKQGKHMSYISKTAYSMIIQVLPYSAIKLETHIVLDWLLSTERVKGTSPLRKLFFSPKSAAFLQQVEKRPKLKTLNWGFSVKTPCWFWFSVYTPIFVTVVMISGTGCWKLCHVSQLAQRLRTVSLILFLGWHENRPLVPNIKEVVHATGELGHWTLFWSLAGHWTLFPSLANSYWWKSAWKVKIK